MLLLTGSIAAPVTCAGWEPAARDRMACCKRAEHASCHDQTAADNCCAQHEQSRQPGSSLTPSRHLTPAALVTVGIPDLDTADIADSSARIVERRAARRLHGPPGFLAPPLRL
jgi:hypothetical protein